jgi:hypothetical protein
LIAAVKEAGTSLVLAPFQFNTMVILLVEDPAAFTVFEVV